MRVIDWTAVRCDMLVYRSQLERTLINFNAKPILREKWLTFGHFFEVN